MGRSENSRNRVFEDRGNGDLWTAPADPAKVADPSLIIYRAMAETTPSQGFEWLYVVSNGAQTDAVVDGVWRESELLLGALGDPWAYEPDAPNFTPRITGLFSLHPKRGEAYGEIMLHKKSPFGDGTVRILHRHDYAFEANGLGLCVTTYMGDGDPLPAFSGEPYLLPLAGDVKEIAATIWRALNVDNRVALAVKMIDVASPATSLLHVINSREKVPT